MLATELQKEIFIEEILMEKSRIKFRTAKGRMWFTTTVEHVKEGEIVLAFPEVFAAIEAILEDKLFLKLCGESHEYNFEGEIILVRIQRPQLIKVRVLGEIKRFTKTEQSEREDTAIPADLVIRDGAEVLHSYVCSLGGTSMQVISRNHIEEKQVDIYIDLPLRNIFDSVVKAKGEIIGSRTVQGYNEYEVAIVQMENMHRERLEQFLNTYRAEP